MTDVLVPSPLFSYTGGQARVQAEGVTLAEVLDSLEKSYPGIRFRVIDEQERIRPHILFFISGRPVRDVRSAVRPGEEVQIVAALSGG